MLPGGQRGILKPFFPSEPIHIFVKDSSNGLTEAMPQISAALRLELPADLVTGEPVAVEP